MRLCAHFVVVYFLKAYCVYLVCMSSERLHHVRSERITYNANPPLPPTAATRHGNVTSNVRNSNISVADMNKTLPLWPKRDQAAVVPGDVMLGGLMMVHTRDENVTCGRIMRQGGLQATEAMLFTLDRVNALKLIPGVTLGARILDDCDRDVYGLEQSVEFIRGTYV